MKKRYGKLVRDKIPEIIRKNKEIPSVRFMSDDEYRKELLYKLIEEAEEAQKAGFDPVDDALILELADVAEVLEAVLEEFNVSNEEFEKIKSTKKEKKGGFSKKIFLESVQ